MKINYAPGGISNAINDLTELVKTRIEENGEPELIEVITSSQPNSCPHIGTVTTIASAFAFAEHLKEQLCIPTQVTFDELENAPVASKIDNLFSLSDSINKESNTSVAESNMEVYRCLFKELQYFSGIPCVIRTYEDFQKSSEVRQGLKLICEKKEIFSGLLQPHDRKLHIRAKCPRCNRMVRNLEQVNVYLKEDVLFIQSVCPVHGSYSTCVSLNGHSSFIDLNTQLRDLLKGYQIVKKEPGCLGIMFDSSDWSGIWANRINTEGLIDLGLRKVPLRFFTPQIVDEFGGKLSKSLYVSDNDYRYKYERFLNMKSAINNNDDIVFRLYKEVTEWIEEPVKFFRNYSISYLSCKIKI